MTTLPRRPRPVWPRRAVRLLAVSWGAAATARVPTAVETRDVPGATSDGTVKTAVVAKATVTSPAQVGAIAAYLNRLTVNPPGGQSSCPDQSLAGGTLTVTFRARAGGPALAQATAGLSGCAFLSYATTALAQLAVGGGDAGTSLLAEFNHVTGLHWKVPDGEPGVSRRGRAPPSR